MFLQHTYLTIVAKTIAARVLDVRIDDADAILSGRAMEIAEAAREAERAAAIVMLDEGAHFTRQRRAIRDALIASGISGKIDNLVMRLLDRSSEAHRQSLAVATSAHADDDQAFIDAVSDRGDD